MKYRLPVVIEKISDKEHMARAEFVRATAVGDTPEYVSAGALILNSLNLRDPASAR